jgi:glycosyltransferase involved in cell wall biosynthesis
MVDASPSVPAAPVARMVDVVVPVFDETTALRPSIERLHAFMTRDFPFPWRISDNASTDGTAWEAARLARDLRQITVLHLDDKGRGRALRAA